jgi:hypothetical protein
MGILGRAIAAMLLWKNVKKHEEKKDNDEG